MCFVQPKPVSRWRCFAGIGGATGNVILVWLVLGTAAAVMAGTGSGLAAPEFTDEIVIRSHEGEYFTFINPAAVVTAKGTVILFLEGRKGSNSDFASSDLVAMRSTDAGQTWSKPQ